MSDRELLEAAAKAAGIKIEWERDPAFIQERWQAMVPCGWAGQPSQCEWNPLREDGDALRLAVKLRLQVHIQDYGTSARPTSKLPEAWVGCESGKVGGDHAAATRRAITRAAAEIGRARDGREP